MEQTDKTVTMGQTNRSQCMSWHDQRNNNLMFSVVCVFVVDRDSQASTVVWFRIQLHYQQAEGSITCSSNILWMCVNSRIKPTVIRDCHGGHI